MIGLFAKNKLTAMRNVYCVLNYCHLFYSKQEAIATTSDIIDRYGSPDAERSLVCQRMRMSFLRANGLGQ